MRNLAYRRVFAFYLTVVFNHKVRKELHKDSQRKNLIYFNRKSLNLKFKFPIAVHFLEDDLIQNAIITAVFTWQAANREGLFPRK